MALMAILLLGRGPRRDRAHENFQPRRAAISSFVSHLQVRCTQIRVVLARQTAVTSPR